MPTKKKEDRYATKTDVRSLERMIKTMFAELMGKMGTKKEIGQLQHTVTDVQHRVTNIESKLNVITVDLQAIKDRVLRLELLYQDMKQDIKEMRLQIDMIEGIVSQLGQRVRFQEDFPERLQQAENDIYSLKLKIHHLEQQKK